MRTKRRPSTAVILAFLLATALRCGGAEPAPLRILVTNDDGIEAPGLAALAGALAKVGAVTVAAPLSEQSGVSHGMTTRRLIPVRESVRDGAKWYAIEATPASCVRLALESLLAEKPDIVVSGVNRGENVGLVTFYSATVAAAREAAFLRIPAVSVNLQSGEKMDYGAAAAFAAALVRELARPGLRARPVPQRQHPRPAEGRHPRHPRHPARRPADGRAFREERGPRWRDRLLAVLQDAGCRPRGDRHLGRPERLHRRDAALPRPDRHGPPRAPQAPGKIGLEIGTSEVTR